MGHFAIRHLLFGALALGGSLPASDATARPRRHTKPGPVAGESAAPRADATAAGKAERVAAADADEGDEADGDDELATDGDDELATDGDDELATAADDDLTALDEVEDLAALDELDGERWSLRGALASQGRVYFADRARPGKDESWQTDLRAELDVRLTRSLSARLRPWFLIDALDRDLMRYEPLEAYVDYVADRWDARAGEFIESWGIADTSNPLDVLNRTDLAVDPLFPPRRGELGLRLRAHPEGGELIGQPNLAVYLLPWFRELDFPTRDNRISFAPPIGDFRPDDARRPDLGDALFAAVRFDHTLSTPWLNADMQYIAARGPTRLPTLGAYPQPDGTLHIVPEVFGVWTVGGGFRAVPNGELSQLTVKAEVVYNRPYRLQPMMSPLPEDYLQFVAGLGETFPFSNTQELSVIVEYLGEAGADDELSKVRLFDNDLAVRLAWAANDSALTSFEVRAIVDWRDGTVLGNAVLRRQLLFLHTDLQLELNGQYVHVGDNSRGALSVNPSNLTTRLTFSF
jgi:hypothetical protein